MVIMNMPTTIIRTIMMKVIVAMMTAWIIASLHGGRSFYSGFLPTGTNRLPSQRYLPLDPPPFTSITRTPLSEPIFISAA